jgi:hypothetical protein
MKRLKSLSLILLLVGLTLPSVAQKKKNQTWLWEISGNGLENPSYLFGTIHILCPNDFAMSDNLLDKLNKSEQLVLEVADADNPANAMQIMQSMAMKGKTLKDLYTEEEYKEIDKFFTDSIGYPLSAFNSFMPMMAITTTLPKMMGCVQQKSYEVELTSIARKQGKEVKEVETLAQQLHLFDTIPYEIQAKELLRTIREWNKEKETFSALVSIYKQQDFSKALAFIHTNMGNMIEYKDVLLDNRNKGWIEKIKTFAKEKPTFFAFGAGHLGGETGLVKLLKKEGFKVKPLKN